MKITKKIINVLTSLIIVVGGTFLGLYLFGIIPYVVLSASMEPTIETGSLCFINKHVDYNNIKEKDIIAFKLNDGTQVTHRVHKVKKEGLITKGDNNKKADKNIITSKSFIGKNIFWIPKLGYIVMVFQTTSGKIITLTFILLLFLSGILFGDSKKKTKEN